MLPSKLPLAWLTLAAPIAVRTSSRVSPVAASATGLICTRTAGRWPPPIDTSPTPETSDSFCASRVSTKSSMVGSGRVSELTASVRIGASAGLTFAYTGGIGRSVGRNVPAALIAACTSCSATSSVRSSENRSVMTEAPPELVEDICSSPGTCPNCRSRGAVMAEVITSGLAPG